MKIKSLNSLFLLGVILLSLLSCKKDKTNQPPVADAGTSASITLPRDTITIYGSGTDADGQIVSYLWSKVSGPSTAVIASATSASTQLSNLVEGLYVFQLTVFDNDGAIGTDTVSITVNPAVVHTVELQPASNPDEVHMLGNSSGFDETDPNAPEIGGAAWTIGGTPIAMRAVLKFDLSSIPSDAIIDSAKLTLYSNPTPINGNQVDANYGADNSTLIQQITSPWIYTSVSWSNQPSATTSGQIIIPSTNQSFLDLPDIDVKAMVADMVKNNTNYGFFIRLQNEVIYTSRIFCSSKYSDASKHPKLVVVYTEKGK